jgi:alpha-beta hydrolase superfamily lysophospholipase
MFCLLLGLFCLLLGSVQAQTLTVEFSPEGSSSRISGNLIVVVCEQRFPATGPGLLGVYGGELHCRPNLEVGPGENVEVALGKHPKPAYVGIYFDQNQNFMSTGLAEPGEYFGSRVGKLEGHDLKLRLDSLARPRRRKLPSWIQEHALVSQRMLDAGFSVEQATQRFLVGLPPGYWRSQRRYPTLFVSHGFSGNRHTYLDRYQVWRQQMAEQPMLLVSLDCNGAYGHHLFLSSQGNGPRTEVLTEEVVPYLDARFRGNGRRVVYGQSSGGWTAVSLLRRAPHIFQGAAATGPDPLTLRLWWMGANENLYTHSDGSSRMFAPVIDLTMRTLVDRELQSRSYGQFTAFLAAFSDYRKEQVGIPFSSPFDLDTGTLRPEVWKQWETNDQTLWVESHSDQARQVFSNHLALFAGEKDEFGLAETTLHFSRTLKTLDIPHQMKLIPGAGHTNYLDRPAFQRELYRTCYRLAR